MIAKSNLEVLIAEASRHYARRYFDGDAIGALRVFIETHTVGDIFSCCTDKYNFKGIRVENLHGHFESFRASATEAELQSASAVFAFSFGYSHGPGGNLDPSARLPGDGNDVLARALARIAERIRVPLFVQFEIADALRFQDTRQVFVTTREDMGSQVVISQFRAIAQSHGIALSKIALIGHDNHLERCVRLLALKRNSGLVGLPVYGSLREYHADQSQERVISASEFVCSDFVSMAQLRKDLEKEQAWQ